MDPSKTNISHSPPTSAPTPNLDLPDENPRVSSVTPEQHIDRSTPKTQGKGHRYRRIIKSDSVSQAQYKDYHHKLSASGIMLKQPDALSRAYFSDNTANKACFNKWLKQETATIHNWEMLAELLAQLDDIATNNEVPQNSLTIKRAQRVITRKMAENIHQVYKQAKKLNHQIKREHQQHNRAGEIYSVFSEIHEISQRCQQLDPTLKSKVLHRKKDRVGLRRVAFSLAKKSVKNEWTFDFQKQQHKEYMNAVLESVIRGFSKKAGYRLRKLKTFHATHAKDITKIKPVKTRKNRVSAIADRHVEASTEDKRLSEKSRVSNKAPRLNPKNPIATKRRYPLASAPSPTKQENTLQKEVPDKSRSRVQDKTNPQTKRLEQPSQTYNSLENDSYHEEIREQEPGELPAIVEILETLNIPLSEISSLVTIVEEITNPPNPSGDISPEPARPFDKTIKTLKAALQSSDTYTKRVIIARILALLSFHNVVSTGSKGIMINTSNNNSQGGKGGQGQGQNQGGNQDSSKDDSQGQQQRQKHKATTKKKRKKK